MKIVIGKAGARNVSIDLETLLRTRALIQANSGGGKSWLIRRIAEQLSGHVQTIIVDPEGEFATLREKFPFVLVGEGGETPADLRSAGMVAEKLLELRASAVCDLFEAFRKNPQGRHAWTRAFCNALLDAPKKLWHPLVLIIDEFHKFVPERGDGESEASEAVIGVGTAGRKRGYCLIGATQRLGKVRKDVTAELLNRFVGPTFEDVDVDRAAGLLSVLKEEKRQFFEEMRTLEPGNFYCFGRAVSKVRVLCQVGPVQTTHPEMGSAKHGAEPPPSPAAIAKLLPKLSDLPKSAEERARSVAELKQENRSLRMQLRSQPAAQAKVTTKEVRVADPRAIERAVREVAGKYSDQIKKFEGALHKQQRTLRLIAEAAAQAIMHDVPKFGPVALPKVSAGEISRKEAPGASAPTFVPQRRAATPTPRPEVHSEDNGNEQLTPYQLDILKGLAELENIGRKDVPMALAGVAAGKSWTSSTFERYRGKLLAAGLLKYPKPGRVALTDAGRDLAPGQDQALTAEEIQERCLKLLTPYQADLVKALVAAHPEELSREELGQRSGKQASSSTFERYLGSLKSMEIVEYTGPKMVKAADWLVEM